MDTATVEIVVFDPEIPDEGSFYVNGSGPIRLFADMAFGVQLEPDSGFSWNGFLPDATDSWLVNYKFTTPVSWWVNGENQIRVMHLSTYGFRIDTMIVTFKQGQPVLEVPSTPTLLSPNNN